MTPAGTVSKGEETSLKILEAALELFREQGFDSTTMRDIASKAGVATGAAYYYYASKEAIVMAFYERAWQEMQLSIGGAVAEARGLEGKLRALIRVKMDYFSANRAVLRALLRVGADPRDPLSPFSSATAAIRHGDMEWFGRVLKEGGVAVPKDLAAHLPAALWFFQMGIIFYWVTDESTRQARSIHLLHLSCKIAVMLLRLAGLPMTRPLRRTALELMELIERSAA